MLSEFWSGISLVEAAEGKSQRKIGEIKAELRHPVSSERVADIATAPRKCATTGDIIRQIVRTGCLKRTEKRKVVPVVLALLPGG